MVIRASVPPVLVIGLDPYRVPGPWDPKPVADAIDAGLRRFADCGVGVQTCLVGLDEREDAGATVAAIAFNGGPGDTFEAAARWTDLPGPMT